MIPVRSTFLLLMSIFVSACDNVAVAQPATESTIEILRTNDEAIDVRFGDHLVTKFHPQGPGKPFLFPVNTPAGVGVTRPWPINPKLPPADQVCPAGVANDHPHHQSIWLAHTVNSADFWHGVDGRIVGKHAEIKSNSELNIQNDWVKSEGTIVCREDQQWKFGRSKLLPEGNVFAREANWIDVRSRLTSTDGPLVLGDTKEGFFAMRTHPDLRLSPDPKRGVDHVHGTMQNSEGQTGEDVWGKKARWILVQGPVDGRDVFVLFCDHPGNFRHPTTWHARTYGLIAANPFGLSAFEDAGKDAGELTVGAGKSFESRYRIYVGDGTINGADAEELFNAFK